MKVRNKTREASASKPAMATQPSCRYRIALAPFCSLFGLCLMLVATNAAFAGPRAYVSAQTGSDTNTCSLKSPCRQIKHALTGLDTGGEVVVLDSGHYTRFTVRKSASVIAAPGAVAVIDLPESTGETAIVDGVLIKKDEGTSNALIVVLRGLTFSGGRHGINFFSGDVLHVEDCVIDRFTGNGIELKRSAPAFPGDPPTGTGDARLFVQDTVIRKSGASAIQISGGVNDRVEAVIEHCRLENNEDGLSAGNNSRVTLRDSVIAGSHGRGVLASNTNESSETLIENSLVANCQTGVESVVNSRTPTVVVRLSNTSIVNNNVGVIATVGIVLSRGNNTIEGNVSNIFGSLGSFSAR